MSEWKEVRCRRDELVDSGTDVREHGLSEFVGRQFATWEVRADCKRPGMTPRVGPRAAARPPASARHRPISSNRERVEWVLVFRALQGAAPRPLPEKRPDRLLSEPDELIELDH